MWYGKMYFSEDQEIFEYSASGTQGAPSIFLRLPFLESLLSFQELNCEEFLPTLRYISDCWNRLVTEGNREAGTDAMVELGRLAYKHIYFQLPYVRGFDRLVRMDIYQDRGSIEDLQTLEDLRQLPENLPQYQKQVQRFFDLVLDVDKAGRDPQKQAAACYYYDIPRDSALFAFHPIPINFEPGRHSTVLYAATISDMIDYSLRSCVERGITVRRCKNCGRYFPQTGRVTAEYCERPAPRGKQTCRETGAFKQWTKKQSEDPVFKVYRKEYKRRFAWIKAGRISDTEFYAWSEKAREMKKKCDRDIITLDEYVEWLKHS